jgi:hypothetical protein
MTEPNAAFAGAISTMSFARFRASMVTFNVERAPSRPFGLWGFVSMVETGGNCEKTAWRPGCDQVLQP